MTAISDPGAARAAISTFLLTYGAKIPADVQPILTAAGGQVSAVDAAIQTCETLYANLSAITDAGALAAAQALAADLASWCAQYDFHGYSSTGRGSGIWSAMQRDLGATAPSGTTWPAASADPAPLSQYQPAPATAPAA